MDKARVLLDWQPEVLLERRVRYLIGWYWENQSWAKEV
jgi:dTDP-D-glucose 4,6-dehydratase